MDDRTRLIRGVLLYLAVYLFAVLLLPSVGFVERFIEVTPWLSTGDVSQVTMLLVSLVLIFRLGRGDVAAYGLRSTSPRQVLRPVAVAAVASIVVMVLGGILVTLAGEGGGDSEGPSGGPLSFLIGVVLLASIGEEIFARGLLQSFLAPLRERGFTFLRVRLSLPVTVSALLFGLGHLILLTREAPPMVTMVVVSATVLGLIAGYYREKTGSVVPAIAVHMVFNLVGWGLTLAARGATSGG